MTLAIALPLVVNETLVGTAFVAAFHGNRPLLVTALHHLASGDSFRLAIPPHGGDISRFQGYPLLQTPTINLQLVLTDPFLDLAILLAGPAAEAMPVPRFVLDPKEIKIGEAIVVAGYPFAAIGSLLETAQIGYVSALGIRNIGQVGREELILSTHTHPGSSGSPVVRRSDGAVCGVVRGCLAPPSIMSIGNLPLGSDTSVTYATSAHYVPRLIKQAVEQVTNE